MKPEDATLTAVGVTLGVSALLIVYLNRALTRALEGSCGKTERAQFWVGCSHVLIVLLPLVVQLWCVDPNPPAKGDAGSGLWLTLTQLRWGLLGLAGTTVLLATGVGILGWTSSVAVWVDPEHVDDLNRLMSKVRELRAREIVRKAELVAEE
jgi:hypothetical protein